MEIVLRRNVRQLCLNDRCEFRVSRDPWKVCLVIGDLSDLGRQPLSWVEGDAFRADGFVHARIIPIIQSFDHLHSLGPECGADRSYTCSAEMRSACAASMSFAGAPLHR